jgi:hypothetical protein
MFTVNGTEQASVQAPSINLVTIPSILHTMFDNMLASMKSGQLQLIATLQEIFKVRFLGYKIW